MVNPPTKFVFVQSKLHDLTKLSEVLQRSMEKLPARTRLLNANIDDHLLRVESCAILLPKINPFQHRKGFPKDYWLIKKD
jgi:hypothetical protein